jgi:hypothetical protein
MGKGKKKKNGKIDENLLFASLNFITALIGFIIMQNNKNNKR